MCRLVHDHPDNEDEALLPLGVKAHIHAVLDQTVCHDERSGVIRGGCMLRMDFMYCVSSYSTGFYS